MGGESTRAPAVGPRCSRVQQCRACPLTGHRACRPRASLPVRRARPRRLGGAGAATRAAPLSRARSSGVRGLGDALDLDEVRAGLPAALAPARACTSRRPARCTASRRSSSHQPQPPRTPFVIGARRLGGRRQVDHRPRAAADARALARAPHVALVTTDGFLYPNAELERRGLLHRKGFPESYDRKALLRFVIDIKSGKDEVAGADVLPPGLRRRPRRAGRGQAAPTSSSSRASTSSSRRGSARTAAPGWRSATSSTSPSTSTPRRTDIRQWYVERFLRLRETAFRDPASYFTKYAALSDDAGRRRGRTDLGHDQRPQPGRRTSRPPARRATLVLRKDRDHSVRWVRLRKL